MSYINESTSSMSDFITKLDAFLTGTPGWTQDQLDTGNGKWAIHRTGTGMNIYVSFRWDTSSPNYLGVYQALGYTGGNDPGNHPNDSGNGAVSGTDSVIDNQRSVQITSAPIQYWAFEDDYYCHVVVETTFGKYAHFGFGMLDKQGDWTGGEYAYGHKYYSYTASVAVIGANSFLLDGLTKDNDPAGQVDRELFCGTVHAEGLPNEGGSSKWAVAMGAQGSSDLGTDRAANARIHVTGGFRGGPIARPFGRFAGDDLKGLVPMYPLGLFYWDRSTDDAYFIGYVKDVRGVHIKNFAPGDEVTVGSDTWVFFPSSSKYSGTLSGTTGYQGIAYKKVTS